MSMLKKIKKNLNTKYDVKLSKIITDFTSDLMATASDESQKKSFLNLACIAWNISLFSEEERKGLIQKAVKEYEEYNPNVQDGDNYRFNLEKLISLKLELYPTIEKTIVQASIGFKGGHQKIIITSMPF